MRRASILLGLMGLVLTVSAGWAQTELLTNASFETGDLTDWTTTSSTGSGTAVVVTGAGGGACDPGGADVGSSWLSFSTDDGAASLSTAGDEVRVEQTHDVTAFAVSIAAGTATVDLLASTTSVECLPSPDLARVEVEFFNGGAGGTSLGVSGTTDARPADSVWTPASLASIAVPMTTDTVIFRYVATLGASGTSVGIGGDGMSADFTPVELQSFSID